jgi:DNA-binding response OmpR family regulator
MADVQILIVEDERGISEPLQSHLAREGFISAVASTLEEARAAFIADPPDLVLLDVMLPDGDGRDLCREFRGSSDVPIVMLTARGEDVDKIIGLELGADDYVAKPFSPRELAARIRAILRRAEPGSHDDVLTAGDIVLRRSSRTVTVDAVPVEMTTKEFELLACFIEHRGIVLSRERLLDVAWGISYPGGTRTVDQHVAQLRRKLGGSEAIRTVRGAGYKLTL